ncbi:MAG TPA: aldo/keto reductase [Verrucomicrobiae bacterium]|jgi:aryl-alcohol dehydrogenase-like predicted oxidoreductase|nr:aldo/keto reductase [Verrucomicrobiae bacterium]
MNDIARPAAAPDVSRRQFVKWAAATGVMATVAPGIWAQERQGDMIYRSLGRTGERVSAIGLGGFHIGLVHEEKESIQIMRTAIDRGITFFDNSWDYNEGKSEIRMGKALRDGYREKVFLMTKFDGRTEAAATDQINESLKRLQTDHLDLIQFHENIRLEDPDRFFAPAGAMEAVLAAKKAGKVRYIGFTGHKDPSVHLRMLEMAATRNFHFDTIQMPINVMDAHFRSFTHQVAPVAVEQGIGVLGMKPMGSGVILSSKVVTPTECLHFALSQPTSVVITGIDKMEILDQAFAAAKSFQPLSESQMAALLAKTKDAASDGRYELFKTTTVFDSTAHHPEWLG